VQDAVKLERLGIGSSYAAIEDVAQSERRPAEWRRSDGRREARLTPPGKHRPANRGRCSRIPWEQQSRILCRDRSNDPEGHGCHRRQCRRAGSENDRRTSYV